MKTPRAPLGDIGQFSRGGNFTKADLTDTGGPAIHYGQIKHLAPVATAAPARLNDTKWATTKKAMPGDLLIAGTGMNHDDVGVAVAWEGQGPVAVDSHTIIFRADMDAELLAQLLATSDVARQKIRYITGTTAMRITAEHLGRIEIPVPEAQEGADALAKITKLIGLKERESAEFRVQNAARRKQLCHYRNVCLRFRERGTQ